MDLEPQPKSQVLGRSGRYNQKWRAVKVLKHSIPNRRKSYLQSMGRKYAIRDQEALHFVTFTVVNWIDLFVRDAYKEIIVDSLKYCQHEKGLSIHAYCIMTSHVHAILSARGRLQYCLT